MSRTAAGRLTAIVAGQPSRPHVVMEADVLWRLPPDRNAWVMTPAAILPLAVRASLSPPTALVDEVAGRALDASYRRSTEDAFTSLVIEESASPSMTPAAISRHSLAFRNGVYGVRLVSGSGMSKPYQGSTLVPVNTLSSAFHSGLETRGAEYLTDAVKGVAIPADANTFVVSFDRYTGDDGVMPLSQLQSALSSAEDLRTVGKPDSEEFSIPTPKEAIAASLMLLAWLAQERPPSTHMGALSRGAGYGWGSGALRRGIAI